MESLFGQQSPFEANPLLIEPSKMFSSQTIEQTMERLPNGVRRLAAQIRTKVDLNSIWRVLTDYERLSEFIPNLAVSKLISRDGQKIQLYQVGNQKLIGLNFSAEVFLELIEDRKGGALEFHLLKGDFRRFEGAWRLKETDRKQETSLVYELTVQGCVGMPIALIEKRLKQDLSLNLLAVEQAASNLERLHLTGE